MKKVFIFLATGFEEVEAISIIDILRRGDVEVKIVSIEQNKLVEGAHNIKIMADSLFSETDFSLAEMLVLPGGMPGTTNLLNFMPLLDLLNEFNSLNKKIAAICAAPMILGELGLLKGKNATCYPGFEQYLKDAIFTDDSVVVDKNIITSRGPATAAVFSSKLLEILKGNDVAENIAAGMLFK